MAFFGAGEFSRRGRGATFQSVVTNCSVLHHIHYNKRGRGMTMERERRALHPEIAGTLSSRLTHPALTRSLATKAVSGWKSPDMKTQCTICNMRRNNFLQDSQVFEMSPKV